MTHDEFIIRTSEDKIMELTKRVQECLATEMSSLQRIIKVEPFKIIQLKSDFPYFIKEVFDKQQTSPDQHTVEFKGIPAYLFAQCFKYYYKLPLNEMDRKFLSNGMRATFDEFLFKDHL